MQRSITIDIINEKALQLLKDLEQLKLIRLHKEGEEKTKNKVDFTKYKGMMTKQSLEEVDQQLDELREAWE